MPRLALPSGRGFWLAPLLSLAVAAAVTALVVVMLLDDDDNGGDEGPPTLARIALRDAPDEDARVLGTLVGNAPVRVDGRSRDGRWLAVTALDANVSGWISASALDPPPLLDTLPVVEPPAPVAATPAATAAPTREVTPTLTPDYPDLTVHEVFSRDNQLVVVVSNEGSADADGPIEVSVDGGPAHRIDVGKPLRPGDRLEQALKGEYVQRRAQVVVTVRAAARLNEQNAGNNVFSGFVTPDAPNDIDLVEVAYGGIDPHLIVTIRNHSLIPLRGLIRIGIRQTSPEDRLLLRIERELDIAADGTPSVRVHRVLRHPARVRPRDRLDRCDQRREQRQQHPPSVSGTPEAGEIAALRARLEQSRTRLLEALARLTEQDFASEIEAGRSILHLLAALAPAERAAARAAREAAGLPPRPGPSPSAGRSSELAPQAIHDLAGARHETLLALDSMGPAAPELDQLHAVAEREERAAESDPVALQRAWGAATGGPVTIRPLRCLTI